MKKTLEEAHYVAINAIRSASVRDDKIQKCMQSCRKISSSPSFDAGNGKGSWLTIACQERSYRFFYVTVEYLRSFLIVILMQWRWDCRIMWFILLSMIFRFALMRELYPLIWIIIYKDSMFLFSDRKAKI